MALCSRLTMAAQRFISLSILISIISMPYFIQLTPVPDPIQPAVNHLGDALTPVTQVTFSTLLHLSSEPSDSSTDLSTPSTCSYPPNILYEWDSYLRYVEATEAQDYDTTMAESGPTIEDKSSLASRHQIKICFTVICGLAIFMAI